MTQHARNWTLAAGLGASGLLAWSAMRRRPGMDVRGKVVMITGGSRGLGLELAREFGARGASVAICSRDEAELDRAARDLSSRGITVHHGVCDVSSQSQVENFVQETLRDAGAVDILVNNAGVIQVGPLAKMTIADFQNAMDVMFWGTLYPTLAVLPYMRERGAGRIVNVTSIGGKISIPHLLPYSCAKFAAVALSEGLRAELAPAGIKVTTVVPGLMRTGSHLNALFKGQQEKEYAWFSLGAATPLVSISSKRAARSIVQAAIRGDAELTLSALAVIASTVQGIAPQFVSMVSSVVQRILPSQGRHVEPVRGAEAKARLNSQLLNAANFAGERAAQGLNQIA